MTDFKKPDERGFSFAEIGGNIDKGLDIAKGSIRDALDMGRRKWLAAQKNGARKAGSDSQKRKGIGLLRSFAMN